MSEGSEKITLKLEGSRATRGVALSDFENFIENFIAALRDFDRDRRGAQTRKSGHPEARAEAIAAFRLVRFRPGSGIATIEPDVGSEDDGPTLVEDDEPLQVANLSSLLACVEEEQELPSSVTDSLEKAIRSAGDDGYLSIKFSGRAAERHRRRPVKIDVARLGRIREASKPSSPVSVNSIYGRLHQVDFEPDRLAVRSSDGIDWICEFSESLEHRVEILVNRLVWATGEGVLSSPQRGKMTLFDIKGVDQGSQTDLFTGEPLSDDELAAAQGILAPQGLDAVGIDEWGDLDDAYLAALTDD